MRWWMASTRELAAVVIMEKHGPRSSFSSQMPAMNSHPSSGEVNRWVRFCPLGPDHS